MKVINNFCKDHLMVCLHDDLKQKVLSDPWLNSKSWDSILKIGIDEDVLLYQVDESLSKELRSLLVKAIPDIRFYDIKFLYQVMKKGSGISKHDDSNHKFAATLYLNKEWDLNFGGLLIYESYGSLYAHCPSYNTLAINDNKSLHLVTPVTSAANEDRLTLQCFAS